MIRIVPDVLDLNHQALELQREVWNDSDLWEENFGKELEILETALEIEPNNLVTLTNLGAALCDLGKHERAKPFLEKAIALGSTDRNTFYNLGVACINTKNEYKLHFKKAQTLRAQEMTWTAYFDPHAY